ncbi:MAG: hypothetical protein AAF519_06290 [Bacteroidota bacterium]
MKKALKVFLFALCAAVFVSCEFMNDQVEPIVKTEDNDGTIGGQSGGDNPEEPE